MRAAVRASLLGTLVSFLATPAFAAPATAKQACIQAAEEGQQLRQGGKLTTAAERFRTCSSSDCPRILQKDCSVWLGEVEDAIPSVSVKAEDDEGNEVQNAHITVDGREWSLGDGRSRAVDPGPHRFVWVREAQAAIEETATIREGERNRVVVLRAPRRAAPPPVVARSRSISPFVWIGYGLGLAATGTGVGFWALGSGQRSTLQDLCAGTSTCLESDVGASRNNLVVGDVLMGVGIVALAGATYLLVRDLGRAPDPAPAVARGARGGGALGLGFGPPTAPLAGRSYTRVSR